MVKEEEILEELRRIRQALEKPVPPPAPPPKGLWAEFLDFISKYKVLAFTIGLYLGALVKALVDDMIMPIVEFAVPAVSWEAIQLGPFRIGHFIGSAVTFLIIVFVVFLIVKLSRRLGVE